MNRRILAIKISINGSIFKVASIFLENDNSLYISFPVKGFSESMDKELENIKFSYHNSGKNHMQMIRAGEKKRMLFPEKPSMNNIKGIIPTNFVMSFWDINTINNNNKMLDSSKSKHKYKKDIILDSKEYRDLTIYFFLTGTDYDNLNSLNNNYNETFTIKLDSSNLMVATEDKWLGEKNQIRPR